MKELIRQFQDAIDTLIEQSKTEEADGDLDLAQLYNDDANALAHILGVYRINRKSDAMRMAMNLDTAARECIPDEVWIDMGGELIGGR